MSRPIKFRAFNGPSGKMYPLSRVPCGLLNDPEQHDHIMQFTGLKDKNGKEIWEGDIILANRHKTIGVVRFGQYPDDEQYSTIDHYGWFFETKSKSLEKMVKTGLADEDGLCEVLGNIHEHSELLK